MTKKMSDLTDAIIKNANPTVMRSNQIETIVTKLRLVIDELGRNFTNAKNLILELARLLDETHQCEQCQISRKIKEMLKGKINEGKITGKWIEEYACLKNIKGSMQKANSVRFQGMLRKWEKF